MPRNGARDDSGSTGNSIRPSRRSYLKAAGAAAASVPLLAGEGAAATERHGISFDTVVDMVDDAGADPNGNEAVDDALQSAAGSDTLLKFPSGTYKLSGENSLSGYSNFGIVGEGDVTFTVPDDSTAKVLNINYGTDVLVENITIDHSSATPTVQVAPDDGLEVHGLEMLGRGVGPATSGDAPNAFNPMVRSSGGEGMVENVTLHNEGRMGAYSRTGVWIGETNKGTITLRNCNITGFSGNGVYASRTPGVVQVEGGTYKNNDVSQVRIGSSGSYVEGITAETDVSESRSPNPEEMLNGSGIRLEKPDGGSGAEIRDCDVRVGSDVNADGGIQIFGNYGNFTIENTRVEFNADGYSIRAKSADGSGDVGGTFRNVSVTGDATDFVGVLIEDRPNTTVEGCCIQQTGSGRTGLALDNCDDSRVEDCTINAAAQALRVRNCDATISGIDKSGTCPAPSLSSSGYEGASSDDSSSDGSTDDSSSDGSTDDSSSDGSTDDSSSDGSTDDSSSDESAADSSSDDSSSSGGSSSSSSSSDSSSGSSSSSSDSSGSSSSGNADGSGSDDELSGNIEESEVPEPSGNANFVVTDTDTSGGRIPYEVTTSEDIEKTETGGATEDSNDEISDTTADGGVNQWRDAYEYEGEIVALETGGNDVTIKLDQSESTIKVIGDSESGTGYSLEVTGTLEHAGESGDPISEDGSSVSGGVGTFRDVYTYSGDLVQASIEDSVSITTNPETLAE